MYAKILIVIALFPVCLILYFINKFDKIKEPKDLLIKLFLLGAMISCPLTIIITNVVKLVFNDTYTTLNSAYNGIEVFINYFFFVGLIEEFSKLFVVMLFGYRDKAFDEDYDGIVYCVFTSLGFAAFENLLYVFEGGIGTGIARAVMSIPGHASFGFVMGIFITLAKKSDIKGKSSETIFYLILAWLIPALIHGIFDSCLSINELKFIVIYFVFVVVVNVTCVIACLLISKSSVRFIETSKEKTIDQTIFSKYNVGFCSSCGSPFLNNRYCIRCGTQIQRNIPTEVTNQN